MELEIGARLRYKMFVKYRDEARSSYFFPFAADSSKHSNVIAAKKHGILFFCSTQNRIKSWVFAGPPCPSLDMSFIVPVSFFDVETESNIMDAEVSNADVRRTLELPKLSFQPRIEEVTSLNSTALAR